MLKFGAQPAHLPTIYNSKFAKKINAPIKCNVNVEDVLRDNSTQEKEYDNKVFRKAVFDKEFRVEFLNTEENQVLLENKDSKIDSINNYLSEKGKYNGYTVQLYVSQKTDKVREIRKKFIFNFPEMILFDEYIAPNIFLYSGKFQDYNNAVFSKMKLEEVFENTLVVRKSFPYLVEKKMED